MIAELTNKDGILIVEIIPEDATEISFIGKLAGNTYSSVTTKVSDDFRLTVSLKNNTQQSSNFHPPYDLYDTMAFGKYKGTKVKDMINQNSDYVEWLLSNTSFKMTETAMNYYETGIEPLDSLKNKGNDKRKGNVVLPDSDSNDNTPPWEDKVTPAFDDGLPF